MKNSPTKSCELDPLPTWLLKECLEDLLPAIVNIINRSLETGVMPHALKQATVRPLLKKSGLNLEQFGNFRPVSNLSYISTPKDLLHRTDREVCERRWQFRLRSNFPLGINRDDALVRWQ